MATLNCNIIFDSNPITLTTQITITYKTLSKVLCGNQQIASNIESVQRRLGDQVPVSRVLAGSRMFPKMVTSMMETGEQSGVPSKMLLKVAEHLEQEANLKIHRLATLAPVFALFFAAGAVAWQVFGVFGGLLKTYQQLM